MASDQRGFAKSRALRRHQPTLSRSAAADLGCFRSDLNPARAPTFGEVLPAIVSASAPWDDWLEAAVLGGYVPSLEGIVLALRAIHLDSTLELNSAQAVGADGDALGWAGQASSYRSTIAMLESFVADMETKACEINRRACNEQPSAAFVELWEEDAAAAKQRARRALQRASSADDDNHNAEEGRARYHEDPR
jgi:hypothetical protein